MLAILFGLQSAINMAVNLHLMPAKGMTLPFISYGGSSMIAVAFGMGLILALTRRRELGQANHLDGHRAADGRVRGAVDHSHRTSAQFTRDLVTADALHLAMSL